MIKLEEITAVYLGERIRFENSSGDVVIGDVQVVGDENQDNNGRHAIKGQADIDELQSHLSYRFYGRWTEYQNKRTRKTEKQFAFQTFVRAQPHGRAGIIRYLQQAPRIGHARSVKLWDKFGSDAVRILREEPDVAQAAIGTQLSVASTRDAANWLKAEQALENCTIDLIDLLGGRGFPKSTAKRAVKEWGNKAAEFIRRDPYCLMRFRGCGFKRCDQTYLDLGNPPGKLKRQALCAWYTLASDTDGHTWLPVEQAVVGIRGSVGGADLRPAKALVLAKRGGLIATRRNDDRLWLAEAKNARNEAYVAECLTVAMQEEYKWPITPFMSTLSGHQQVQLAVALQGVIAILGGSPGTGKTYSAAVLIRYVINEWGSDAVAVAAPTGKAAVRMTEMLDAAGIDLETKTIHSLLGVVSRDDRDGWRFVHGPGRPLPYRCIVIDESSMIATDLMASLLAARARGTHVLFIGDVNQLLPVSHGAPLRDMIAAGLPYGELREIRRNSGAIVKACAAIRDNKRIVSCKQIDIESGKNLKVVQCGGAEQQTAKMLQALRCAKEAGFDPIWDCQILVAVNKKSNLSRKELNRVLQEELNKPSRVTDSPFRVGDKIVNLKNGFFPAVQVPIDDEENVQRNERGDIYVANGELAKVFESTAKLTFAELENPERYVKIPHGISRDKEDDSEDQNATNTGCTWDLGYALSVHKSQGSEWPVVVVMVDDYPGARMVCSREWAYTAISRAKKLCLLIGKKATFDGFCRRPMIQKRKTFLKELIEEKP